MEMNKSKLLSKISAKLKNLREQWDYERKEMADYLGLSRVGYGKNENGETYPGVKTLFLLSEDHDISIDWLMFDKGPMHLKDKEKLEVLEKRVEELENELAKEHEKVHQLEQEKERLEQENERAAERERELEKEVAGKKAALAVNPEMNELLEHMRQIPLLYHEILSRFQKFKLDNRELVDVSMNPAPPAEGNRPLGQGDRPEK